MDLGIQRLLADDREILALTQNANAEASPQGSFVLCRPVGQEGTRTAAMFRVLSERLARAGCDVWRFDYHGTGDSPGEEVDQTLHGWCRDLLAVHAHAQAQARGPVRWFGMGLGANVALRAAPQALPAPQALVLWEPVLDGRRYARALCEGHRRELAREFDCRWEQLIAQGRAVEPALPGDVLGFDFGPQLSAELASIDHLPLAPALRRGIRVVCAVHDEDREALGSGIESVDLCIQCVQSRTDWMSSQAQGTAIVPPDAIQTLVDMLR